jgi:hypothetical protein
MTAMGWLALAQAVLAAAAAPPPGQLDVRSATTGAEVLVDGRSVGHIPLAGTILLPAGQHTIKITRRGYADYLDVVVVRPRRTSQVAVDLLPLFGVLRLASPVAGARVFVDGTFVGQTGAEPLEVDLAVGTRSVRVVRGGYAEWLRQVDSIAGREVELQANLALLPVGSSPFRPAPPPPPRWYERWYVWVGGAAAVAAVTAAILIPLASGGPSGCTDLHGDLCYDLRTK